MTSEPPDPTVQLVCWSGPASALALRLGCARDDVLAGLRLAGRDTGKAAISLPIALANSQPIWAATRRRLAGASAGVDAEPGIADHRLMLGGER